MNLRYINDYIEKNMSKKRKIHTYAVAMEAASLSKHYGEDASKAEQAALFHDFYRGLKDETLNIYVRQLGLDSRYQNNSNLAHGKIAAIVMKRDYNIEDQDMINAVSYHTTGRAGMSKLEKILYLADAIEPNRTYPGVEELRKLAYEDLDKACLMSLNHVIDYVTAQGLYLDEDTIKARDSMKEELEGKENKSDK